MKLVKYYGWERFFEERILNLRKLEQRCLRRGAALKGLNICLVFTVRSSVQELLTDCLSTGLCDVVCAVRVAHCRCCQTTCLDHSTGWCDTAA